MLPYGSARYASIWRSASVPAVEVRFARLSARMPELKPATIALMPIAMIVIAIRSSMSPNPPSLCSLLRTGLPDDREGRRRHLDARGRRPAHRAVADRESVASAHAVPPRPGGER